MTLFNQPKLIFFLNLSHSPIVLSMLNTHRLLYVSHFYITKQSINGQRAFNEI